MPRETKQSRQETRIGAKIKDSTHQQRDIAQPAIDSKEKEEENLMERHVRRLRQLGIKVEKGPIKPQERNQI